MSDNYEQDKEQNMGSDCTTEPPDSLQSSVEINTSDEYESSESDENCDNSESSENSTSDQSVSNFSKAKPTQLAIGSINSSDDNFTPRLKTSKHNRPIEKARKYSESAKLRLSEFKSDIKTKHWWLQHVTYFRVHIIAYIFLIFIGAIFIYAIERAYTKVEFIDALFVAASAATVTGVSSINFAEFGIPSQLVTLTLIFSGGAVLESLFPVLLRLRSMRSKASKAIKTYNKSHTIHSDLKIRKCHMLVNDKDAKAGYIEYLAVKRLMFWIIGYFMVHQITSFFLLGFFFQFSDENQEILDENNVNAWYCSAFHVLSSMNNAGFSPLKDNLVPFQRSSLTLLTLSSLVMAGNVLYPILMRFYIWLFSAILHIFWPKSRECQIYRYLLKYPRRCGTHLFPISQTIQLFFAVFGLTLFEFVCILAMDWHSSAFEGLNGWNIVANGWSQSAFTRTAGFNSINLAVLNPAMLVIYVGMMYISAYPIVISMRKTAEVTSFETEHSESERKSLSFQAKRMVAWDAGWVFVPWVIICLIESSRIEDEPIDFNIFNILFEIVSAYGTVGLTLGYPGVNYSFSGVWRVGSKLVLILVMLMGRHRGLPDRIDKAVNFSESQYLHTLTSSHGSFDDLEMIEVQSEDDDSADAQV